MGLAHWDDVEGHRAREGRDGRDLAAARRRRRHEGRRRSTAFASRRGKLPTPPHSHGASEEVFFVLGGSGLAWQDDEVHEVRPGDCVIHRADDLEHTFVAGPDGLDYLVFGTRHPTDFGWLPRSRRRPPRLAVGRGPRRRPVGHRGRRPAARVRRARAAPAEHPQRRRGRARALGAVDDGAARDPERSEQAGFHWERLDPGETRLGAALPLRGGGDLRHPRGRGDLHLWPSPSFAADRRRAARRSRSAPGHVVARPPATGSATPSAPATTG